ncbi:hypothetical protein RD792_013594 [Penstemon davidsonii]|uniref:Importin N-terminal domain-containing protein n=1 Tax=Penstemon davidsonii TaxID=160366 RepID=A0ABR0CW39_9LAMI|nr:hypothetical protein RD792_013594 [Penstemon davidsonii]
MEVTQVLLSAQSVDSTVRKHAEDTLKQFQEQNLPGFLLSLSGELANEEKPVESRKLAGLILKNALDAKEQHRKYELVQRWFSLDVAVKSQIKACLLQTLSSTASDARSTASQVIAKVAGIELPQKQWPELIGSLLSNIHQVPPHVKQATLETLGYLCEEVVPDVVDQDQVNKILTAVVQGMNANEGNIEVRLSATRALYNALGFAQANFSNDMERDYIMRVVCEATLSPEVKIRQAAFECLVSIGSLYYEKLAPYIQDIFNITSKAVRGDEEPVALQAIEFWSTICDEETDILEEYGGDSTADSDVLCHYFIKQALPALVPMLLETLLKQEEDQDQDEGAWNLAMAGGTCLGLVARTVGDDIVPLVMPFIEENIMKADWRQREAATYAFGSIIEGPSPDKLTPIVNVALNFMLTALTKDVSSHVKDTTAWTLGRIFEFLHGSAVDTPIITPASCHQIITVLLQSMTDAPNVAEKACGALNWLAQGYEDVGTTSPLTPYFQEIVKSLLNVTHREDAGESRLRTAAYETLNEVVRCSSDETAHLVLELVQVIMTELHNTLEAQRLSSDEREKQNELQGLLCGCLQVIIQKLGASEPTKYAFSQYTDQIMSLFLRVLDCRNATVHEEAMLAIGALAYAIGPNFAKYMPDFYKYLEMGLQNFEEYQVCAVTVGVVVDICRALEDKVLPYCDGIMTQLLKDLSSNLLHRSVKPPIFSCFGDIALAIGENFEKYLMYAMPMLQSAAECCRVICSYIRDDVVMKTAIGVLGDLADTLGSNAGSLIQQSLSSKDFLNECLSSDDHLIKESAEWARENLTMEVTQVLLSAQSVDSTVRKHAEDNLKQFQEQNLSGFLLSLSGELANEEKPVESRKLAGLILKNALDAKEQHRKYELVQRWFSLDVAVKSQIKACLLQTLSSTASDARSTASQVIAKVAGIELPQKQWPELIGSLLSNIHQVPSHVKQATLETLGYLCEEVVPDVVDQDHVNKILTAVVQGMNANEGNIEVRLSATRALYNALGFAQANFSNDMERDYIMRVVCEATLSPEVKIRQAAFECLVSIGSIYYEKLAPYIQDIFNITSKAVREDEEPVALQAIEFWSSICDEETDILDEYGGDLTADSDVLCYYFIKQALPALVPMLLETLLKQEEDQDQDEGAWNLAMAGGTCLGLVARTVGDDIVPLVMPFIEENIMKADWRQREAATYAFGSIIEGPSPDKLTPIVNVALNFMLTALTKDVSSHVKDTTAWTLGRIFEFLHGSAVDTPIITPANCQPIITVLLQSMTDAPNVAEKACGALYWLAQGYEDVGTTSPLTPYFQEIVKSLLNVTHREDAGESRLRTAAYETLNEVVRCSSDETAHLVLELVQVIMTELHNTLEAQRLSSDEREKQNELQGLLCGCLQVIIQKLGASEPTKYAFSQYTDQIMNLFLRVFAFRNATAQEEAMLAIGALAYATGPNFAKYMPDFYKYLEMGLQNFEEYQVCAVTVGVVGDICRALEDKVLPYCDGIMTQLLKDLSSNQLHRSVKPPIFSCFGDIALAIGENFEKYLMYAMPMLQSAAELSARTSGADDEMTEYTNLLRNGILEAYSGIFQGFKNSPKTQLLIPFAPHILQFLDSIYMEKDMDDIVMKTAIGVLGDLADTLGSNAGSLIQQSLSSKDFLNECLSSDDHLIKESAEWASNHMGWFHPSELGRISFASLGFIGIIESSGIGVRHVTLLQKGSVKENSRKLLGVNGLFDYDYAVPNPKHGKKGGTKTPPLS